MAGACETTSALLVDIARILGTSPEAFRDPACLARIRQDRVDLFVDLLTSDPHFARIAQAFLDVQDPAGRRAIADTVVAIAGAFGARAAARGDG